MVCFFKFHIRVKSSLMLFVKLKRKLPFQRVDCANTLSVEHFAVISSLLMLK